MGQLAEIDQIVIVPLDPDAVRLVHVIMLDEMQRTPDRQIRAGRSTSRVRHHRSRQSPPEVIAVIRSRPRHAPEDPNPDSFAKDEAILRQQR